MKYELDKKTNELLIKIGEIADKANLEVFAIGGFVRDLVLKRPSIDLDFVVVGDGLAFARLVADMLCIKNIVEYEKFQTAFIPYKDYKLEFVSARSESYAEGSRNPIVQKANLNSDILRRDFTVNTLAFGLNKSNFGEIIDNLDGIKDLELKIIRTPLNPVETFKDDPLRIMRAIRFASQLHFTIDEMTLVAINETVQRLDIISMERIRDEFVKIMESPRPSVGLWLLYNTGVLQKILPELTDLYGVEEIEGQRHKNNLSHTFQVVDQLSVTSDNTELRFAALFHDIGKAKTKKFIKGRGWTFHNHEYVGAKMVRGIFYRLKLPKDWSKYVTKMVRLHMRPIALTEKDVTDSGMRRLVVHADEDLQELMLLAQADITSKNPDRVSKKRKKFREVLEKIEQVKQKDKLRAFQSPVRGVEIMKIAQLSPGPKVGVLKKQIEEAILDGIIANEYEAAKEYLLNKILKS